MLGGAARWTSQVASWTTVVVVATATTAGLLGRLLTPDAAPYLLVTREVADRPLAALALFAVTLGLYVVAFRWLCRVVDRWRGGTAAPSGAAAGRVATFLDHVFGRWYRIALTLAVVWLPFYVTSFPGQPSPDAANMFTEFLSTRSDFADRPPYAIDDLTAPFEDYPTSSYLLPDGDSLWSNHHPLYLMLAYGSLGRASIAVFDSLVPAVVLISAVSALLTLVAFGRALAILGRLVPGRTPRALALGLTAATPLIALWSMAPHKNQLFCAGFVWWLALLADLVHRDGPAGRRWYVETTAVSLLMAVSVPFGWIVLAFQAGALLFVRRHRYAGLLTMGLPALLVFGSVTVASASGAIIPSDPIETKGLQLQELGLILSEHPDALTDAERADLSRIFDLDAVVDSFDPSVSDPLKSTGPLLNKSDSFRYQTVQPEDWDSFNTIVLRLAARHPDTFLDGLFLKSYRYLDPLDEGTDWYPPWAPGYDREVAGHQLAPIELNSASRGWLRTQANHCYESMPCRVTMSHGVKTVAVVLMLAAAIAVRRRFAWLWALPFALQLGIAGVSPLSAGGRYVLAFSYALGVVVLLLAVDDGARLRRAGRVGTSGTEDPAVPEEVGDHPDADRDDLGGRRDDVVRGAGRH